jgi:23S rRNA (cytosine1962-C5)-methyltransferase
MKNVILKPGKDKPLRHRHHWIFSGAIQTLPEFRDGDFLSVKSSSGDHLGFGYFNRQSSITGRMVSFDLTPPLESIEKALIRAINLRKALFKNSQTNAYRLINGEGDFIPGLVVDLYRDVLVIQISTLGVELLKDWLVQKLIGLLSPQAVYEKSTLSSRREEKLQPVEGVLWGTMPSEIEIQENGIRFIVIPQEGQKTGFFLDQREMRNRIHECAKNKRILNCFSYTGGFSIAALTGGAKEVVSVDSSEKAIQLAERNTILNGLFLTNHRLSNDDVFTFLRENPLDYDLVILDPPAFAKKQRDVNTACRGYKDINRLAMQKMPSASWLLTCSCSYYVDEPLFQKVIFQAAVEAKRSVRIMARHQLAPDHPINICHPEGHYLKSLFLYLD